MRKLKLEMQVSIDGFASDANGDPSWMLSCWSEHWTWDEALRRYHTNLTTSSDCILLSRKMAEEGFCEHWEQVAKDAEDPQSAFAKPISDMPKLVFSKSGFQTQSRNAEVVRGDATEKVESLKRQEHKTFWSMAARYSARRAWRPISSMNCIFSSIRQRSDRDDRCSSISAARPISIWSRRRPSTAASPFLNIRAGAADSFADRKSSRLNKPVDRRTACPNSAQKPRKPGFWRLLRPPPAWSRSTP
jgi:RibD C-terminal domain